MDRQGRVRSFEILTRDQGMAKIDTLRQGQTRGETDADDYQGLEASPSHRQLEALDANGCAQAPEKASDGHTLDQPLQRKRLRAGTACARCQYRKIKCSELPCRQCSLIDEICTPRPKAGSQKRRAITQFSLITGGENDPYHVECTVLSGISVEYTLPMSRPADIVFPEEWSRVIDYEYNIVPPKANAEEARGQMAKPSTFMNPCMPVGEFYGWPFQDARDSMSLATVCDFMGTLPEPDWGWGWPRAQHLAQNGNSALQPPSPALEPEEFLFRSEPAGSQPLDNTATMFFWGEQPPVSEFLAMRGRYTAEGQHFPPRPTWLYPVSGFEWQDPTLGQAFESTDVPLPTKLHPTPMQ